MASTEWKNVAAGAAVDLGHLDAHHPEGEQRSQQAGIEGLLVVHRPHQGTDLVRGELADAVAEQPLVVGERRKGRGRSGRCDDRLGHGLRGIMAEACSSAHSGRDVHVLRICCARVS